MPQASDNLQPYIFPRRLAEAEPLTQRLLYGMFALVSIYVVAVLVIYFGFGGEYLAEENSIVENSQAAFNLVACVLFLAACRHQHSDLRVILLFFACLSWAFFLREVDVEDFDLPQLVITLGSGKGRNTMLAILFLSILATAAFSFKHYLRLSLIFLKALTGKLILSSGALLICSDIAEKASFIPHHVIFEELFELIGFAFLVFAAVTALQTQKRPL